MNEAVLERITAEQFQALSVGYTVEAATLKEKLPEHKAAIQRLQKKVWTPTTSPGPACSGRRTARR